MKQSNDAAFDLQRFYLKKILRLAASAVYGLAARYNGGALMYLPSDVKKLSRQLAMQLKSISGGFLFRYRYLRLSFSVF